MRPRYLLRPQCRLLLSGEGALLLASQVGSVVMAQKGFLRMWETGQSPEKALVRKQHQSDFGGKDCLVQKRREVDFHAHMTETDNDVHLERAASNPPAECRSIIW